MKFSNNEEDYSSWLAGHPNGFVFNHFGGSKSGDNVIHLASCWHLHREVDKGRRTVVEKLVNDDLNEIISRVNQIRGKDGWKLCASVKACPSEAG